MLYVLIWCTYIYLYVGTSNIDILVWGAAFSTTLYRKGIFLYIFVFMNVCVVWTWVQNKFLYVYLYFPMGWMLVGLGLFIYLKYVLSVENLYRAHYFCYSCTMCFTLISVSYFRGEMFLFPQAYLFQRNLVL